MYTFGHENSYKFNLIIVTGACRSGKTTLCKYLSTYKNVEWIEEPYGLVQSLIMQSHLSASHEMFWSFIISQIKELCIENILMRNVNFRPGDLSSIMSTKTNEEIEYRLNGLLTRSDALDFIHKNETVFLIDIPQLRHEIFELPHLENLKSLHVVRSPLEVCLDIVSKKWYSDDQLLSPKSNELFYTVNHQGLIYYLPWWVEREESALFLNYSEMERGLFYWKQMNKHLIIPKSTRAYSEDLKIVSFDAFIEDSKRLLPWLGKYEATEKTKLIETTLYKRSFGPNDLNIENSDIYDFTVEMYKNINNLR